MNMQLLTDLLEVFGGLSFLAVGGGNAIIPDIYHQAVLTSHWLSASQFAALFTIAQIAPGPSMLIVPLIGWTTAGWGGALAASVGMFVPSCFLGYLVSLIWNRFREKPWRSVVEKALAPLALGLVFAGGLVIVKAADHSLAGYLVTAATVVVLVRTKLNPLIPIGLAGVLGFLGFV